jgi:hypothetical protein
MNNLELDAVVSTLFRDLELAEVNDACGLIRLDERLQRH